MTRALGNASLTMVNGGDLRIDGGAMHGVVPKNMWSRWSRATSRIAAPTRPTACWSSWPGAHPDRDRQRRQVPPR